ncbi:glycosyltransferase [Streptomyces xiamenensis]
MKVLLCPLSDPGFLYPVISVGLDLKSRGHDVLLIGEKTATPAAMASGLAYKDVSDETAGAFSARRWFRTQQEQYRKVLQAAKEHRPDVIVTSALCHGSLLAAERLQVPIVVIGLSNHLWPYKEGSKSEPETEARRHWRLSESIRFYNLLRSAEELSEASEKEAEKTLRGTLFLLRGDPRLEYPDAELPDNVHHVGPCFWEPPPHSIEVRQVIEDSAKPLIYVHLGRVFQGKDFWPQLNSIFTSSPFRAIVELGRSGKPQNDSKADIKVVRLPWMSPILRRAQLVITSATSAPVLGALLHDLPLVVAPAGSEQPVLAASCVRAGVGTYLPDTVAPEWLAEVISDSKLMESAREVGISLRATRGAAIAATYIEKAAE